MKDTNQLALMILGAVLIGALGFFAGRHTLGFGRFMMGRTEVFEDGDFRGHMGMMGGGFNKSTFRGHMGFGKGAEVTKINGSTVSLKYPDGSTQDVALSGDAVFYTMNKGSLKDIKVGQTISIMDGGFFNGSETVIVKPQ